MIYRKAVDGFPLVNDEQVKFIQLKDSLIHKDIKELNIKKRGEMLSLNRPQLSSGSNFKNTNYCFSAIVE